MQTTPQISLARSGAYFISLYGGRPKKQPRSEVGGYSDVKVGGLLRCTTDIIAPMGPTNLCQLRVLLHFEGVMGYFDFSVPNKTSSIDLWVILSVNYSLTEASDPPLIHHVTSLHLTSDPSVDQCVGFVNCLIFRPLVFTLDKMELEDPLR